ncbi:type II secretion system major pseudopilin GspG [Botrimarina sp.]|uniref:type II secretion system major pseudopilin GspG n=1 Tax=Botrimarina sp. TaxID=2795802 RepID=UPI0032EAD9C5
MNKRIRRRSAARAFTLLEVLLVLVILVVLGSMASVAVLGSQDRALKNAAKSQVQTFRRAIDMYQFNMKKLPESLDDLVKKPSDAKLAERWGTKPYLDKKTIPLDPWDNEYRYEVTSDDYRVWSTGPDGNDGTDDDISTDE